LLYLLFRRALAVASLRLRSREFEDLEIVALRHELAVLRRQSLVHRWMSLTASSLLRPASYSAAGHARSSSVRTPCWVGIASSCVSDERMRGDDRAARSLGGDS
jgi:hypothetical protein